MASPFVAIIQSIACCSRKYWVGCRAWEWARDAVAFRVVEGTDPYDFMHYASSYNTAKFAKRPCNGGTGVL